MEYFRDPKNQIYADLAYRMGRIVVQYEKMNTDDKEEKFESSLYLAALQNLSIYCKEHITQMIRTDRKDSIFNHSVESSKWGISKTCWVKNTFVEELNLGNFISRIRNSVSHPTKINLESEFPSTGFSTVMDDTGLIQKFRFINSPDTKNNRRKYYSIEEFENTIYKRNKNNEKIIHSEFPGDINYEEVEVNKEKKFTLTSNGKPFIRLSIIDLTVNQLGSFVKDLSNYLAQPIQENWDGITIKELIAA